MIPVVFPVGPDPRESPMKSIKSNIPPLVPCPIRWLGQSMMAFSVMACALPPLPLYGSQAPNIVLVLTDDQGYGDLGRHGNPDIKTPAIDAFAQESIGFTRFYVSPVCAPTRASLLTGRYNYRTGVTDTWFGRATMHPDEVTLAEVLKSAGYATGLFGKWHLGDTYPHRPQDQGFDEVLMHRGGGIAQPSCPLGNSYFDPLLYRNGVEVKTRGYCMDVYTDATLEFIEANRDKPFFAYLATNTPHTPLQVPDKYVAPYLKAGLPGETSRIYGMITNIDDNFARILKKLEELSLAENTIIVFMSDNGPEVFHPGKRHLAGLNGRKTDVYEGGIRTPFYLRWPQRFKAPVTVDTLAAHIDLMPTLLDACGIGHNLPAMDGRNLLPLMRGDSADWPPRTLFLQWHRGNEPTAFRNFTAVEERYKLLQRNNKHKPSEPEQFELYDLIDDPGETRNIADAHPEVLQRLKASYRNWLEEVSSSRGYGDLPSWIGSEHENPVVLTQQDRRDATAWGNDTHYPEAYWPIRIVKAGDYRIRVELFGPAAENGTAILQVGDATFRTEIAKGARAVTFPSSYLDAAESRVRCWIEYGPKQSAPHFLIVELIH